ncbi:Transcription initiation factor TFIID subunit 3, partial [Paragonimus westermani]
CRNWHLHHLEIVTTKDKRLITNLVKHVTTHNRVLEEEQCWREILHRRTEEKERANRKSRHDSHRKPLSVTAQQALDAYERQLRLEAKRQVEELAAVELPRASGRTAEFWHEVVEKRKLVDRWGHDGWEELQKSGPPPPLSESFRKANNGNTGSDSLKLPVCHKREPIVEAIPQRAAIVERSPTSELPKKKKQKHEKKTKSKKSSKRHKCRSTNSSASVCSDTGSLSTLQSDEEIEWLERKLN